ncbi:MAG: DUF6089 family protein [Crocinitomicaceae bacterium]|nr:DUF6089 family protein [Crocinitomicaceae bacterium]
MLRKIGLFVIFIFACNGANAQGYKTSLELGVYGGGSYYLGDINPNKHFVYSKPAFGAIVRYNLTKRFSLRFNGKYGSVYGNDSDSDDRFQQTRNLSFQSKIIEASFGCEIDMFKYNINDMRFPITPYFFYEVAYMRMNPMGTIDGEEYALNSLGTEGQGTPLNSDNPYSLNQLTIPLGIGVKFNLKKRVAMSFEYGIRKTFTDYLDDVSGNYVNSTALAALSGPLAAQFADPSTTSFDRAGTNRGNPGTKDWYVFYGAMITFKPFKKDICEMRGF